MSKTYLVKTAAGALLVGAAVFWAARPRASHPLGIGDLTPDFVLSTLGSKEIARRDFRQRVVVVNFWATWCPPCVEETPSLEKFASEMRNEGVTVIGISVDRDEAALAKFAADYHLTFPIARDPDQAVASRFGTFKFPETYILDRQGKVAEKIIGATDWQDPRLVAFVRELVGHSGRTVR